MIEFPISGIETYWWLPTLVAMGISMTTSTAGVTGAFILLPFQVSILGYTAPGVSATNLMYNVVAIPGGVVRFWREQRVLWPIALGTAIAGIPGLLLGAVIRVQYMPDPRPFKLFAGGPMGSGNQYLSWLHMADQIAAMRFLMENQKASGAYNLTAPNPVTNKAFAKLLGRVMKRPAFMPVPGFAMRLAFGEVATVVLDGQRVLPTRLQEQGFEFRYPEAETALRDILNK